MSADTLRQALEEHGMAYEVSSHEESFTAQELAATEHLSGYQVAKPVFLMAEGDLVMAVLPAPYRIDLKKARTALGTEVRLARESEFDSVFADCDRGAEPPVGTVYGVPTIVDERLTSESIMFDAGSHSEAISMARDDYLKLAHPKMADLAVDT